MLHAILNECHLNFLAILQFAGIPYTRRKGDLQGRTTPAGVGLPAVAADKVEQLDGEVLAVVIDEVICLWHGCDCLDYCSSQIKLPLRPHKDA